MAAAVEFVIDGPIARSDVADLLARLSALLDHSHAGVVLCRLRSVNANAESLDALARLALVAVRHNTRIMLEGASGDLRELIAFAGLRDVLPT